MDESKLGSAVVGGIDPSVACNVVEAERACRDTLTVALGQFAPLLARGLMDVLRDDRRIRVVSGDCDGARLWRAGRYPARRVLILDETAGRAVSSRVLRPGVGIVVLAREPTVPYGMLLLAAGVSCVDSSAAVEDVLAAVHLTAQGGCIFVSGNGDRVERADRDERILTERKVQVLEGLSDGKGYREIAQELKISVATVKKHAESLLPALGASSKRDLVGLPTEWLTAAGRSGTHGFRTDDYLAPLDVREPTLTP
jgi:DNA-binding NarL/FixJ family response regulator